MYSLYREMRKNIYCILLKNVFNYVKVMFLFQISNSLSFIRDSSRM